MRNLVRFVCVVLISVGVGFLVYGTTVDPAKYQRPAGTVLYSPTECVAWGSGMLVGGVLFLLMFGMRAPTFDKPGKP